MSDICKALRPAPATLPSVCPIKCITGQAGETDSSPNTASSEAEPERKGQRRSLFSLEQFEIEAFRGNAGELFGLRGDVGRESTEGLNNI